MSILLKDPIELFKKTMFTKIVIVHTFLMITILNAKESGDRDCLWFGASFDTPIYPIEICSTYFFEGYNDGMFVYSTKYACDDSNNLWENEYNDTDCTGPIVNSYQIKKGNGANYSYYWNCDSDYLCPYVKMKFYELYHWNGTDDTDDTDHTDDDGECVIDTFNYEE
eukprot:380457_1